MGNALPETSSIVRAKVFVGGLVQDSVAAGIASDQFDEESV